MAFDLDQALTGISGILVTPYDEAGDIAPAQACADPRPRARRRPASCRWSTAIPASSTP